MLSEKIEKALNEQMNFEIHSGYIYAAMAAYLESVDLGGFATWMSAQAAEEMGHAMKFYEFIHDRGGRVIFDAIPAPPKEWSSLKAVFEGALEHERIVTGRIHSLVDLAIEERDHATQSFLKWLVDEQVEEEATADEWIKMVEMADNQPAGIMMLNREAGARTSPVVAALATPEG